MLAQTVSHHLIVLFTCALSPCPQLQHPQLQQPHWLDPFVFLVTHSARFMLMFTQMRTPLFGAVVAILAAFTFVAVDGSLADLRQKVCNSDSDCVRIVGGSGNMMIDGLNFATDNVDAIRSKVPEWFGPARPIQFLYREKIVSEDAKLADLGILIGGVMRVISQPQSQNQEL